jgi:hypothetical protein
MGCMAILTFDKKSGIFAEKAVLCLEHSSGIHRSGLTAGIRHRSHVAVMPKGLF